jgi:hypothetical protein
MIEPSNEEAINKKSWISRNSFLFYNILAPLAVLAVAMLLIWGYFQIFPKYQNSMVKGNVDAARPVDNVATSYANNQTPADDGAYSPDRENGASGPDEHSLMWSCSRTNSNGSGTVPCVMIHEVNYVVFNFTDDADITFWLGDSEGPFSSVDGVQAEGSHREQANGFCEFIGNGARCEATSGTEVIKYEAK